MVYLCAHTRVSKHPTAQGPPAWCQSPVCPSVQVLAQAEMARVEAEEFQRVLEENKRIEEAKLQQVGSPKSAVCGLG